MNSKILKSVSMVFFTVLFVLAVLQNGLLMVTFTSSQQQQSGARTKSAHRADKTNVIFTETNTRRVYMSSRELCAVESAAKHNPESNIIVFSAKAVINDQRLLDKYPNVQLKLINLNDTFKRTILNDWWFSDRLAKNEVFRTSHISDALRFLFIYQYGGVYSDLDTITIKSYKFIRNYNGMGASYDAKDTQAGVLHFTKEHKFIHACLQRFSNEYNGSVWGANGPMLLSKEIASFCDEANHTKLLLFDQFELKPPANRSKCSVGIYPKYFFYPYDWKEWNELFKANASLLINKFLNTYSVHFYGKVSSNARINKTQNTLFDFFASFNCPHVYENYGLN